MAYDSPKKPGQNNGYKGLTKNEEHRLIRAHQSGDQKATVELLNRFDLFIKKMAWGFTKKNPVLAAEDTLQASKIGFLKALNKFDFSYNGRLSTYASWWVSAEIQDAKKDAAPESWVSRSGHVGPVFKVLKNTADLSGVELEKAFQKAAADTGIDIDDIRAIRERLFLRKSSLDAEIGHDGSTTTWVDMLESPYAHPIEAMAQRATNNTLYDALNQLKPREKDILVSRFGLQGMEEKTLEELSQKYDLSRERVRQIERSAIANLTKVLKTKTSLSKEDIPVVTGDLRWNEPRPA